MSHYICRTVTELPSYMFALIKIQPEKTATAGEIYKANTLDSSLPGNYTVYVPEDVSKTDLPVIVLNDSFETLTDGRRPNGQPDYTQYVYKAGEVINTVRLEKDIKLELGTDALSNKEDIKDIADGNVANTWIYINDNGELVWTNNFQEVVSKVYLYVESVKYFRLGGQFGMGFARTLVVRVKHQVAKNNPGDPDITKIDAAVTPNLLIGDENTDPGAVIATLTVEGGTQPFVFELVDNETVGADNSKFVIEGNEIKVGAEALTDAKTYQVYVGVTDSKGKTFNEGFDIIVGE